MILGEAMDNGRDDIPHTTTEHTSNRRWDDDHTACTVDVDDDWPASAYFVAIVDARYQAIASFVSKSSCRYYLSNLLRSATGKIGVGFHEVHSGNSQDLRNSHGASRVNHALREVLKVRMEVIMGVLRRLKS